MKSSMKSFLAVRPSATETVTNPTVGPGLITVMRASTKTSIPAVVGSTVEVADAAIVPMPASAASVVPLLSIKNYIIKDKVTKAEVLWSMKCIMSHFSMNSCGDIKEIFQMMFTDSSVAQQMSIGSTKLSYYISYGLAPYFHNCQLRLVLDS